MSWRISIAVILVPALLLAACGFEPLHAKKTTNNSISKLNAGVKIDPMPERAGQLFKADLEDRLNPPGGVPGNPAFRLHATLQSSVAAIGVARDNTVSRYNLYLTSTYTLFRTSDDKAVTSGTLTYVGSYNNLTNAYFSTYTAEQDAIRRGVTELAEQYRQRLSTYLDAGAPEQDVVDPKDAGAPASVWQTNQQIFNNNAAPRQPVLR